MNKILSILCCILAVYALTSISHQDLSTQLSSNKNIYLVYHTGNKNNQDAIQRASQHLRGFFKFVQLQSSQESLQLYGDDRSNPIAYSGQYSAQSIVTFALNQFDKLVQVRSKAAKQLKAYQQFLEKQKQRSQKQWEGQQQLRKKSNTILLEYQNWNQNFIKSREPYLINFYQSNCSACIELNKQWQLVSTQYKGKIKVAKINITDNLNHNLEQQLKIKQYPTIRFYQSGPKKINQFSQYEGTRKKFSISAWVNTKLSQKVQKTQIASLNKQNYQTMCKGSKNTCILVFLDDDSSSSLQDITKLALQHIKKPVTFLISKKGQQSTFAEQLGVVKYPDTVMIYCKLKKYWHMESLNIQEIDNAINQISLGNRNNFVKYNFVQQLK